MMWKLAIVLAVPCKGVQLRSHLGDTKKYVFTEMDDPTLSTCTQVCASKNLGCDNQNLPWKKTNHMKTEVDKLGYDCKGTETVGDITAPMIELKDSKDRKGPCYYPASFSSISCDAVALAGYRNLCYCTEDAIPAEPYQPIWPYDWVFPNGEGSMNQAENCICYAKKGEHGASAMPGEILHLVDTYSSNQAYVEACVAFCDDQETGPYHAADAHFLYDWSSGRPAIIVLHGSGGSKDEQYTRMMAQKFAAAGFFVLSINYQENTCPEDIGNAVEWLQRYGNTVGVDPNSVGLYGWSQGGRCVYNAGYSNHQVPYQSVKAVVDMSGCGGKGPLNNIDNKVKVMPPPLLLAHATNDGTISINDCHVLVDHSKKKSWDDNGSKGKVLIKELYFEKGGHNLLKNTNTEPVVVDEIFDHYFKYLGRPCKRDKKVGVLGATPVDKKWPTCKTKDGESITRCGGVYDDFNLVKKSCQYP